MSIFTPFSAVVNPALAAGFFPFQALTGVGLRFFFLAVAFEAALRNEGDCATRAEPGPEGISTTWWARSEPCGGLDWPRSSTRTGSSSRRGGPRSGPAGGRGIMPLRKLAGLSLATLTAQDLASKLRRDSMPPEDWGMRHCAHCSHCRVPQPRPKGAALQFDRIIRRIDQRLERKSWMKLKKRFSPHRTSPLRGLLSSPEPAGIGGSSGSWPPAAGETTTASCPLLVRGGPG